MRARHARPAGTTGVRTVALLAAASITSTVLLGLTSTPAEAAPPVFAGPRGDAPVVLTGLQLPSWSRLAAVGASNPATTAASLDGVRSAHNGTLNVPSDVRTGIPVDEVAAWRWDGSQWREVPVQVDQRFPYFLANAQSDFGVYSGTDQELSYSFAPDAHATGEEAWKKVFGECSARYASTQTLTADIALASIRNSDGNRAYNPAPGEQPADYTAARQDPVATFDDDDELAFQAGDAGPQAPRGQPQPVGTLPGSGQTVAVSDPTAPGSTGYVYLFRKPGGSMFNASNGYVQLTRDANADEWISRASFTDKDSEKLGSSNTGYGANLPGTTCDGGVRRNVGDRFPRDGVTVTTDRYRLTATGRWMVRGYQVRNPAGTAYGPDLIDRWKGRAFQQSPDSSVSLVGFEDEQVNWEANAALLGWRQGPVRAIREVWGADSGTNVTKTETYYRAADTYRYRIRVHPIPSDGLYTSWDYNKDAVATYYNSLRPDGVAIDGINDDTGQLDKIRLSTSQLSLTRQIRPSTWSPPSTGPSRSPARAMPARWSTSSSSRVRPARPTPTPCPTTATTRAWTTVRATIRSPGLTQGRPRPTRGSPAARSTSGKTGGLPPASPTPT